VVVRSTGWAIHHTSKAVHRLLLFGTALLVIASCLLAGAAWRLAQGPIDLGWLADRVRTGFITDAAAGRVSFDSLSLAWEGFHEGGDYPLDLRVSNFDITDPMGRRLVSAPDAHLTLSLAGLLMGHIVPRTIEVDHGRVTITREATGQVNLGWGSDSDNAIDAGSFDLNQFRQQLAHPASTDHGPIRGILDQIRRAHFLNTDVTFHDFASGLVVRVSGMNVDLFRAGNGHIRGSVRGVLSTGGEQSSVAADLVVVPGAESSLTVQFTPFRPAAIQPLPPSLEFLADVDTPVSLIATVAFDAAFKPGHFQVTAELNEGRFRIAQSDVPLRSGTIALSGTVDAIAITTARFDLAHSIEGPPEIVDVGGTVARIADRLTASLTVGLERINVADLPRLWPIGIGGGARPWVTEHIISGMATRGSASFVIEADKGLHDVVLTKASGDLDGTNGSFTWLDNIPAVQQAEFHLHLVDPDTLDIHLTAGRQLVGTHGDDLAITDSDMRITGLSFHDQVTEIHVQAEGQIASALALLSEPKLHLLSVHPIGLSPKAGEAAATLDFRFPLENKLRIDDVQIRAAARLTHVRMPDVAGGQELDDGAFDLNVDKDGLRLKGGGTVATVPVTLEGTMDFDPGAPDQIVQKIAVTGQPDAAQLNAAGLHVADVASGSIPMTVILIERRNGDGSVSLGGDLTQATVRIAPLAWSKPPGTVVNATATLLMSHDRLTKIDHIVVYGDDVTVNGSASFVDGHLRSVKLDTIRLGRTVGHGTIHIPATDQIDVVLQGSQIDLAPKLTEKGAATAPSPAAAPSTPAWTLRARFDHAILANGESASNVLANVTGAGGTVRLLDVVGATQTGAGFSIKIEPGADKRHLSVEAMDAGGFLRGLDTIRGMQSGHLKVEGVFDSLFGLHPLAGTAVIDNVTVRNSPVLGRLLQAITLYGLVDVLRGPGITFSRIVAPFHYDGVDLNLDDAHAANSSLGLTAEGRIGLSTGKLSMNGTIVPAYFFNSILGQLPLVGKLFSPEKGGGVFAARFGLDGSIDDPSISINPVSALTPGFLREIFGIFDKGTAAPPAPATERPATEISPHR
jgi:hypothetical protein